MDYLYEFMENHTCYLLRGNREEYMLTQQEARKKKCTEQMWISNSASGNLLYTYGQLVDKDFDFFRTLPITFIYEKAGFFCSCTEYGYDIWNGNRCQCSS